MRILTGEEVRRAEEQALARAEMSPLTLTQRAGYAAAQFCIAHFKFTRVCIVCGRGKKGGYGLVAAAALRRIAEDVAVIMLAGSADDLGPEAAAIITQAGLEPVWADGEADLESDEIGEAMEADLVLDAIADAGAPLPISGLEKKAVAAINDASGTVVSLDLPSGADGDSSAPLHERGQDIVFAQGIIAFIAPRPAHVFGNLTPGPVAVSELGVHPALTGNKVELSAITGQEPGIAFPPRSQDSHKSDFGHVLVIAGSRGKAGAACLTGLAALHTGAGLVTVACPESIEATVAGFSPELMTEGLSETPDGAISLEATDKLEKMFAGKDVVVAGPGFPANEAAAQFVRRLAALCPLPLLLNGNVLDAFAGRCSELKSRGSAAALRVLALNSGEAVRLLGVEQPGESKPAMARRVARETGACVALTGPRTVVAGVSGETWVNLTGNPALARGGSGEVLCGMIGAALARRTKAGGPPPVDFTDDLISAFRNDLKVAAAVYLHGLAGDLARDMLHENTVMATDQLRTLTDAFRDCELQTDRGLFYLQR